MKKITIYTTPYSPFCIRAKQLLENKNIDFHEIDLSKEPDQFDEMSKKSNGARTVPQIFVDDTHIKFFKTSNVWTTIILINDFVTI